MKPLRALLCSLALAPCVTLASAGPALTAEQEARALIGRVHATPFPEQQIVDDLSCRDQGAGTLVINGHVHQGWSRALARCQGRFVMMLKKLVRDGENVSDHRWRVVDAYPLPEVVGMQFEPDKPEGPYLYTPHECELRGDTKGNVFYAVVRLSKRKRMDWRTGVLGAWSYDMKQQRIVPLDLKRVVCHKPEPE